MNAEQVKLFQQRVGGACWRMDLTDFERVTGFVGFYAKEKFLAFRNLSSALDQFDAETLVKLIGAGNPAGGAHVQ